MSVQFAIIEPVNVRSVLVSLPVNAGRSSYAEFWLQPQAYHDGRWQGGETIMVKRVSINEFKIGTLALMSLDQAAQYVEHLLDRYRVPYVNSVAWMHPFIYEI